MCPEVLKAGIKFALHLIIDHSGDTYSAGIGQLFQACGNIHAITIEVVTIDHEVTHIHADAKDDGTTVRQRAVKTPRRYWSFAKTLRVQRRLAAVMSADVVGYS